MSFLPIKHPWTRKPNYPVGIDWTNPLSRGLTIASYLIGQESTARNLADRVNHGVIDFTNFSWEVGRYGRYLAVTSTDDTGIDYNCPFSGTQNRTVIFLHIRRSNTINTALLSAGSNNSLRKWTFRYDASNALRIELNAAAYTSSLIPPLNELSFSALTFNGTTLADHTIYLNGKTESAAGASVLNTNTTEYRVFGDPFVLSTTGVDDDLIVHLSYNRALPVVELDELRANIYQLLDPQTYYLPVSAAAVGAIIPNDTYYKTLLSMGDM